MKIIGTMLARNEAWCLRASARAALGWCDELVILDHVSTDETPAIIDELVEEFGGEASGRVRKLKWLDPFFRETMVRQMCLIETRARGATHVAIVDADEIIAKPMAEWLTWRAASLQPGDCLYVPTICVWNGLSHWRCEAGWAWGENSMPLLVADGPDLTWCGSHDGYDWHTRAPFNSKRLNCLPANPDRGGVLHLQFANLRRLRAKQALYQMNEAMNWPLRQTRAELRTRYEGSAMEGGLETKAIPEQWWPAGSREAISLDDEPWHESEVKRLLRRHGAGAFGGLNLFGLENSV